MKIEVEVNESLAALQDIVKYLGDTAVNSNTTAWLNETLILLERARKQTKKNKEI